MNKQELIEKYKTKYAEEPKDWRFPSVNASRQALFSNFINDLEQLDEPKKVVVPEFVSDWISCSQLFEFGMFEALRADKPLVFKGKAHMNKCKSWIISKSNQEIFVRAWLDGYEVEKEPLYHVLLPDKGATNTGYTFLNLAGTIDFTICKEKVDMLTENQIKAIDERYWAFAVKVEG
ncbi:TPA: DUF1642 domain-containing protein [Enterococcus faecalis]